MPEKQQATDVFRRRQRFRLRPPQPPFLPHAWAVNVAPLRQAQWARRRIRAQQLTAYVAATFDMLHGEYQISHVIRKQRYASGNMPARRQSCRDAGRSTSDR